MNLYSQRTAWMSLAAVVGCVSGVWGQAATHPAERSASIESEPAAEAGVKRQKGVITGDNVYVRSGSDRNYYPVTKLHRGDEVVVVGERFGWIEIEAPAGTHSLIDQSYAERKNGKTGIVNGRTWVFAGSDLDKRRYAKQVKLVLGDRVKILGETEDGAFYKIEPPAGATVWVSGDYVDRSGKMIAASSPKAPRLETVKPGELKLAADGSRLPAARAEPTPSRKGPPAVKKAPRTTADIAEDKYQLQFKAIETEIAAESAKPASEQNFEPIIAKLHVIANEADDEISPIYAKARISQLRDRVELVGAIKEMHDLRESAVSTADAIARVRARIKAEAPMALDGIVVRGEIRVSGIYNGLASRPKRWRIEDPKRRRTLAYIEVPKGSPIDPVQYYGKYIGVRASSFRQLHGIPPLPIYTVEEIVVLDPKTRSERPVRRDVTASPAPKVVPVPRSQPAGN